MKDLKKEYEQMIATLLNFSKDESFELQVTEETVACLMICKHLDRVSVALETINENLSSINDSLSETSVSLNSIDKNFEGCISVNRGGKYLGITGEITTY